MYPIHDYKDDIGPRDMLEPQLDGLSGQKSSQKIEAEDNENQKVNIRDLKLLETLFFTVSID